jgi:hypothetical protein
MGTDEEDEIDESEQDQDEAPASDDPRTQPLRYSVLKAMKQSPAHARALALRESDGPSLAFRLGAGAHALTFGTPEVVVFNGQRRRSKENAKKPTAWDEFEKANAGKVIVNAREYAHAKAMADAIKANEVARRVLLANDAIREERINWTWNDRAWRSTPDARAFRTLAELKTTRCADPAMFWRDALRMSYHVQLAIYRRAVHQHTGIKPREVYLFAVESKPPYVVTPFMLTERSLEHGDRLASEWHARFLKCEAENAWPAYTTGIEELDVYDPEDEAALEAERALAGDDGVRAAVEF